MELDHAMNHSSPVSGTDPYTKGYRDGWNDREARAGSAQQPTRTCATCHAVLADGPQPASTYEAVTHTDRVTDQRDVRHWLDKMSVSSNDGHEK
jgi:hypothetical protein